MEQSTEVKRSAAPDAIVVLPAGMMPLDSGKTAWRSTTYEENDAFGTLGGRDRVEAAALLVARYPNAYVVTLSHTAGRPEPSLGSVYAEELCALGIPREKLIAEASSNTTQTGLRAALDLAKRRGWKRLMFVSSGFHISRVRAFLERERSDIAVDCVASEPVLSAADPSFALHFAAVQKTAAYQNRLAAEQRGIQAIRAGTYRPAPKKDKREREV